MQEIRSLVPSNSIEKFDSIVNATVLGASNHIRLIAEIMSEIVKESQNVDDALKESKLVSDYFINTRGKSSYAIVNALGEIDENINQSLRENPSDYKEAIIGAIEVYFIKQNENMDKIILYSNSLVQDLSCIMLYDYSSTVERFVNSVDKKLKVYIPESRVINGGYPYLSDKLIEKHDVHFIADASIFNVLNQIEACFIGAETFYPDGTAFNTVGSDMLAELCYYQHIPFYVLTPLLKNDKRATYGQFKQTIEKDLKKLFATNWSDNLKSRIDFNSIELVKIKPERITNYVTEFGIIKPSDLFYITFGKE